MRYGFGNCAGAAEIGADFPCEPNFVGGTSMSVRTHHLAARVVVQAAALILLTAAATIGQTAITTYHVDNNRTGWNSKEKILTPTNVSSSSFKMLHNVALDGIVDSQPLFVPGVNITAGSHQGIHDVVYVATENDTIYAIDAESGVVLLSPNFGPAASRPLVCGTPLPVGITSTPVIDLTTRTMYAITDTQGTNGPVYRIHALDLPTLTDKVTPQVVSMSHTLADGSTFTFNAADERQRPALLLTGGSVYAGFSSYCDENVSVSRGLLLGWAVNTLTPLPNNTLTDTQATSPSDFFLSSIWMSGYGPSTDDSGNILFVTGNSDPSGTTYDGVTNIQESVVKVSPNLAIVEDLFTPSDQGSLDMTDFDFGSGGVMVLPNQPGVFPHLAVAAGKEGNLFLMNEDHLGGYSTTKNNVLGTYDIGHCACGPSYFVDPSDGIGRVVTSGSWNATVYKVNAGPKTTTLGKVSSSPALVHSLLFGFFTMISSNGTANPIIWAVSRASSSSGNPIYLYAFNPESVTGGFMQQLVKIEAGNGKANTVPVVANGEVFVASYSQLQIFGLAAGEKMYAKK